MRERWGPGAKALALTPLELTSLVQPAFPGQSVVANDLTSGGLVNTNVRLELSVHRRPVLLRLYTRDPNADAAPMPDVVPFPPGIEDGLPSSWKPCWACAEKERLGPDLAQALMAFAQREPDLGASLPAWPSESYTRVFWRIQPPGPC